MYLSSIQFKNKEFQCNAIQYFHSNRTEFSQNQIFFHQVIIIGSAQLHKAQILLHIQIISEIDMEDNNIRLSISEIEYNIETNSYRSNLMVWKT